MTSSIEESLTELTVTVPDPKTGEPWTVHTLNHYNDGVSLIVSREREGLGMWIEDPNALRAIAEWFETAANQIEEAQRDRADSGD